MATRGFVRLEMLSCMEMAIAGGPLPGSAEPQLGTSALDPPGPAGIARPPVHVGWEPAVPRRIFFFIPVVRHRDTRNCNENIEPSGTGLWPVRTGGTPVP